MREIEIRQAFYLVEHSDKSRLTIAKTALQNVREVAQAIPESERLKTTVSELQSNSTAMLNSRKVHIPGFWYLSDGIAASWTTERKFDYLSHRIIIPTEDEPVYHRKSIRGDIQAIDSTPLVLEGLEKITTDDEATLGMLYPTDLSMSEIVHLVYDRSTAWKNVKN